MKDLVSWFCLMQGKHSATHFIAMSICLIVVCMILTFICGILINPDTV